MASAAVTELVARMGLDTGPFEKGLARAQSTFASTVHNITNLVSGPLTAAFGALGSGAALSQYLNQADSIGKMADSIGIDIEALQAWGEAAERAGGSSSAFQQTVKGLNQRLQEIANGGGAEVKKTLDTLGVSVTDTTGKTKDTLDVLRDLAEKSEGMDKQKFTGLAQKMGIDHGTIMLLQSGKMSLDDLIKRQKALGVYTKEDAEIAAKANDAIADLQQVLKAFAAIIARVIVPGITFLTDKLVDFVSYIKDHKEFVVTAIVAVGTAITVSMIPALARMATAAWAAVAPFAPFIAAGLLLAAVIDDLCVYIEGGDSALADFWSQFGTGPEIAEKLKTAWEYIKETFKTTLEELKPYLPMLGKMAKYFLIAWGAGKAGNGIAGIFGNIGKSISKFVRFITLFSKISASMGGTSVAARILQIAFKGILTLFKANWFGLLITGLILLYENFDKVKEKALQCWDWIVKNLGPTFEKLRNFAQNFKQNWLEMCDNISNWFSSTLEKIKSFASDAATAASSYFSEKFSTAFGGLSTVFNGATTLIEGIANGDFTKISNGIQTIFSGLTSYFTGLFSGIWGSIWDLAKTLMIDPILKQFDTTWADVQKGIENAFDNISSWASEAASKISGYFSEKFAEAINGMTTVFDGFGEIVDGIAKGDFTKVCNGIKTIFDGLTSYFSGLFSGIWGSIWDLARTLMIDPILKQFDTTWVDVQKGIETAFDNACAYVKNIFKGVIDSIKGWINDLVGMLPSVDGIKKSISGAWDNTKNFLGFGDDKKKTEEKKTESDGGWSWSWPWGGKDKDTGHPIAPMGAKPAAQSAVTPSVVNQTNTQRTENNISNSTNINGVTVYANDPRQLAEELQSETGRRAFGAGNAIRSEYGVNVS